jgi:hypothetical protein
MNDHCPVRPLPYCPVAVVAVCVWLLAGTAGGHAQPPAGDPVAAALATLSRLVPTAELFVYGAARAGVLDIVVEIPSARVSAGRWMNGAEVDVVANGPDGAVLGTATGTIAASSRSTLVSLPRPIGALGPWRVRAKVTSGKEALEDFMTLWGASPSAFVAAPIVYRASAAPRAVPRPVAEFQFHRTERVHLEWPVAGPLDSRAVRLLNAKGQPLGVEIALASPSPALLTGDFSLAAVAPADYVLDLTAARGGRSSRQLLAIRVLP